MLLPFLFCQFLCAADSAQQPAPYNNTAIRLWNFWESDPKPLHYPCAKTKDTAFRIWEKIKQCVVGRKPKEEIDFKKMIDAALETAAKDASKKEIKDDLNDFRDWFNAADLSEEDLPEKWLNWIQGLVHHDKKPQSMREKMAGILPIKVVRNCFENMSVPNSGVLTVSPEGVNAQIRYDMQLLLLAIQLEHNYLQLNTPQNWDDSYFKLCSSQYMSAMAQLMQDHPVTATMPILKGWLKHAERYDSITTMHGWPAVHDRILYPYLDDTRILCRFGYDMTCMGVLAMSVFSLYLWIYNYSFFVDLFAGLGIINGTNAAHQAPEISRLMAEEMAPSASHADHWPRHMQTAGIEDVISNLTSMVQNSSLALRALAEASASMPCDQRQNWLRNIFGQAINTEGNWVACIMGLGASNAYGVICQMLSTGNQYASAFGQCQPLLNGAIDPCKAQIVFGNGGIIFRPERCDFNASTPKSMTESRTIKQKPGKRARSDTDSPSQEMTEEVTSSLSDSQRTISGSYSASLSGALSVVQKLASNITKCLAWLKPIHDLDGFRDWPSEIPDGAYGVPNWAPFIIDQGNCPGGEAYYPNVNISSLRFMGYSNGGAGNFTPAANLVSRIKAASPASLYSLIVNIVNATATNITNNLSNLIATMLPIALDECLKTPPITYVDQQIQNVTDFVRACCLTYQADNITCKAFRGSPPLDDIVNGRNIVSTDQDTYFMRLRNVGGLLLFGRTKGFGLSEYASWFFFGFETYYDARQYVVLTNTSNESIFATGNTPWCAVPKIMPRMDLPNPRQHPSFFLKP